jgi:hypothetical protein
MRIGLTRNAAGISVAVVAVVVLAVTAGTASAQPPVTGTSVSTFSESFADEPFRCEDELYEQTVSGHTVVHFTYFPDTGAIRFHDVTHLEVVAVPLDGTGTTYTGHGWFSDTETIKSVKAGELLIEQDTDFDHLVARGSDGSSVRSSFHAHFTMNANGELSVQFEKTRDVCA